MIQKLTFRPEFDGPQRQSKAGLGGHQVQNLVRHTTSIERSHTLVVQVLQDLVVHQINLRMQKHIIDIKEQYKTRLFCIPELQTVA